MNTPTKAWLRALCAVCVAVCANAAPQEPTPEKKIDISTAWDAVLQEVVPQLPADPVLIQPQTPFSKGRAADFLNHFFFQSSTEYTRDEVSFTGRPTPLGIIAAHEPFQPNADRISEFMNWGTRGWLSRRINTNLSIRYKQDLSHVEPGSPEQTILNTFPQNRRVELLGAFVEIKSLPGESKFQGTSLQLGRQYTYGAELAAYDGASFTLNRRRVAIGIFGGRRFTYEPLAKLSCLGGYRAR